MIHVIRFRIFNPNVESLRCLSMNFVIPPKICMDIKSYPENSACDWLQYSIHVQQRELLCTLFHNLAHFGMAKHYSNLFHIHLSQLVNTKFGVFYFSNDFCSKNTKLSHGCVIIPLLLFKHLAQCQRSPSHDWIVSPQHYVKKSSCYSNCILCNIGLI